MRLLRYSFRSVVARRVVAGANVMSVATLVFALAASLMLLDGLNRTLRDRGDVSTTMVLGKMANAEVDSRIPRAIVTDLGMLGGPNATYAAESVVVTTLPRVDGRLMNVLVRGTDPKSIELRPHYRVREGRTAKPGTDEAMIGVKLAGRIANAAVGQRLQVNKKQTLAVVGVFSDDESSAESEVWCDRDVMAAGFNRSDSVSSIRIRAPVSQLRLPEDDRRFNVKLVSERVFFERQGGVLSSMILSLGVATAILVGIGAGLGVAMAMFGSVSQRIREIGTLRTLGFSASEIRLAFITEAAIVALAGAALGSLATLVLRDVHLSFVGGSFSEVTFGFAVGVGPLGTASAVGVGITLFSALLPAHRASRIPPVSALRG